MSKRDPYASSLAKPQYRQQVRPDKRHAKRQRIDRRDMNQEGEDD